MLSGAVDLISSVELIKNCASPPQLTGEADYYHTVTCSALEQLASWGDADERGQLPSEGKLEVSADVAGVQLSPHSMQTCKCESSVHPGRWGQLESRCCASMVDCFACDLRRFNLQLQKQQRLRSAP